MKKIAIIGSGDLGQLIAHHLTASGNFEIAGFFDDYKDPNELVGHHPVIGGIEDIVSNHASGKFSALFMAIGYKHMSVRESLFSRFSKTIGFESFVHSSCWVDPTCHLGSGVVVLPGCVLDRGVSLKDNVLLNVGCVIAHDSSVGEGSFFGPRVSVAGFTAVGRNCFIGIGTVIKDNIVICDSAQTGAGAVVCKSIDTPGVYLGVPARRVERV
ncbi:acetyltransferase [Bdellovibrio bacteriovorus]|uniref:acetyltransferase n=1 Tax=Bdellovibrio bacteriovorus TaxID=959 RepID=UPI0005A19994|nr:acetyltransferase [Bdellovibrio bacteriovorus]